MRGFSQYILDTLINLADLQGCGRWKEGSYACMDCTGQVWRNDKGFVVGADDRKSSTDRFGMNQRRGYRRLLRWPTYTPVHCRFRRGLTGKKYIMKLTQGSLLQVGLRAILQLAAVG